MKSNKIIAGNGRGRRVLTSSGVARIARRRTAQGEFPMNVISSVCRGDTADAIKQLGRVSGDAHRLPEEFLAKTASALRTGDWAFFPNAFRDLEFVGPDGRFLLIAPYSALRGGKRATQLSAVYGSTLSLRNVPPGEQTLRELFGELRQEATTVVPITVFASAGLLAGQSGEAFIVPNGWAGMDDGDGPALNNMDEQLKRVDIGALKAIERIFDKPSAQLILGVYATDDLRLNSLHSEYQYHEYGHAAGLTLSAKLTAQALSSAWYGAVEEWRADGVGFEVASRILPPERAGQLVASNLITRFGIDAHRVGGLDLDTDVNSALLTFRSLLESGLVKVSPDSRLGLVEPTFAGLCRATEWMRASTVALTRREMRLRDVKAIWTLYTSAAISEGIRHLFCELVVKPVHGIYEELR